MKNIKEIIDEFIKKLDNEVKNKSNLRNISAESFLYNYNESKDKFISESSKIKDINILNLINFSNEPDIIKYLSISKGVDSTEKNSFIYYLLNFLINNKQKIYNYWEEIFNNIIKKKKKEDEKNFETNQVTIIGGLTEENKLNYIKKECNTRVNEGIFINESLKNLRNLITYILKEKNKDKINISPQFLNKCFDFYCTKNNCFKIGEVKSTNDIILEILQENKININELIMCVFCVLNISPDANNPPPVKYLDINNIKKDFYNNMNIFNQTKFNNFNETMLNYFNKYDSSNISKFNSTYFEILKKRETNFKLPTYNIYKSYIEKYIEHVDNYNAVTSIGTLEFVDKIAKFNLTNIICNKEINKTANENEDKDTPGYY